MAFCHNIPTTYGFLPTTSSSSSKIMSSSSPSLPSSKQSNTLLYGSSSDQFKQKPGESDIAFIKRITNNSQQLIQQTTSTSTNSTSADDSISEKPVGKYQRIEEWDSERKANGQLTWEEKVQFDGQRFGNQVKQDHILRHHIGTFF
jgi:hypothetical protein